MGLRCRSRRETDERILEAFGALAVRGVRITDRQLADAASLGVKAVKNHRQRMAREGRWPGPPPRRTTARLAPEIEQYILARFAVGRTPTQARVALEVAARFGRVIDPKAVSNVLNRPAVRWLAEVQRRIRAEALREYHSRRKARAYHGEPAWQILRSLSAAEGRVRGLVPVLPTFFTGAAS